MVMLGHYTAATMPWWLLAMSVVIGGPFGSLVGMNVMHSSNHGGLVKPNSPILTWVMEHSLDLVGGGSGW